MICTRHEEMTTTTLTSSLLSVDKFKTVLFIKHIVNASSCAVELPMHMGGLLSSQKVEV